MATRSDKILKLREQRLQELWPVVLVNGVEIPIKAKGSRGQCSTDYAAIGAGETYNIMVHVESAGVGWIDPRSRDARETGFDLEHKFPRILGMTDPALLSVALNALIPIKIFWPLNIYDFTISLIGAFEYQVSERNFGTYPNVKVIDGRGFNDIVGEVTNTGIEVGIYWLMVATSINDDDVKVFFPVIVGNWDGVYPEELDAVKREGFFKAISRPVSPPILTMDLPKHLTSQFSRIQQKVLDRVQADLPRIQADLDRITEKERKHKEEIEFAKSNGKLIEFRIQNLELDIPRFPNSPYDFEMICADWLKAWGHEGVEVTQKSGDYGIDVVSSSAVCQAKFFSGDKVGRPDIQNLKGAASVFPNRWAVFFAFASGYTNEAIEWSSEARVVLLQFDTRSGTFIASNHWGEAFIQYAFSLTDADLTDADLTDADLITAYKSHANLIGLSSGADLIGADLSGRDLSRCHMVLANLFKANLSYANLSYANLSVTNLIGADLSGANLSGANLLGANLTGANLTGANLTGANLKEATMPDGSIHE